MRKRDLIWAGIVLILVALHIGTASGQGAAPPVELHIARNDTALYYDCYPADVVSEMQVYINYDNGIAVYNCSFVHSVNIDPVMDKSNLEMAKAVHGGD